MLVSVYRSNPSRYGLAAALLIWCGAFAVMIGLLLSGRLEAVPYGVYAAAGRRWLEHEPLYETVTIDGFQYFPQSAFLFAPFAWLGAPIGDVAWRAIGWILYASGIWRLARRLAPAHASLCFLLASCLAVIPATGSLGNGQANLVLGALMLHATSDLIGQRWWRAAWVLTLGFALKPLMVVTLLLVWAVYRPMTWRIPPALACAFLAPWLVRDHDYVMQQYTDCLTKLGMCATPGRLFEDVRGLFAAGGWVMPHAAYLVLRLAAALVVLGICSYIRKQVREPRASLFIAAFAASYLMLFNPRTLSTSYVMVVSYAALLTALYILQLRKPAALVMGAIVLSWTVSYHMVGLGFIQHWLRPLACLAFCAALARELTLLARRSDPQFPS
jgi:hypothetical protein